MLADIRFLCAHNLMDYSLLLIIERNPDWEVVQKQRAILRKQTLQARKATLKLIKEKEFDNSNITDSSAAGVFEQSMDNSALSAALSKNYQDDKSILDHSKTQLLNHSSNLMPDRCKSL
jgi:hypothetical protein